VLGQLPEILDPNVLVASKNDDDGVYRLTEDTAVVLSTDFFTPIVDDPRAFGAIAAANALSDVWAMGGRAVAALNIAMFPDAPEFQPILKDIIRGGSDKMAEAGVSVLGGHTIRDREPKFGYAVMGLVHPDKIHDNSMARPGDALVLTKKIGTGVVSTGIKQEKCGPGAVEEITASMAALNKRAGEIMLDVGVSTATDVTGFGLIGHLLEVLSASGRRARLSAGGAPFFEEAVRLAEMGVIPAGTRENLAFFSPRTRWEEGVREVHAVLLNDAQTSGGLLFFVPAEKKKNLVTALQNEGILAAYIGDVLAGDEKDEKRVSVGP
jgi:selenide,water dikinase